MKRYGFWLILLTIVPLVAAFGVEPNSPGGTKGTDSRPATQPGTNPTQASGARIAELIAQLGSEKVLDRESAQKALVRIGKPALEALRAAAKDKDPERASRAEATKWDIMTQVRRECRFALYLVTEPRFTTEAMKTALEDLKLSADPAVCDEDIAAYDWDTHVMHLTPEGLAWLPGMWGAYQPFVLIADGNRIYMGELDSMLNSVGPTIPMVSRNRAPGGQGRMGNELRISPGQALAPDPRNDPRIRKALEAAGKLRASTTQPTVR
jgi:hypothetical protein